MRILFFGDGAWATSSLLRLAGDGHGLPGVVLRSRPTDPALAKTAQRLRLPVFQPPKVNAPEFVRKVEEIQPDLNLSVSYDQILRRPLLETAPLGFINFHAGKLPYYRGRSVINWAIINGEEELGLTAHYVAEAIDAGDIILQRTISIGWEDTYGDVLRNATAAMPDLVAEAVSLIERGLARRQPHAHLQGTYFPRREEGDEWLDWSDSSRNLHNKVRALAPPGPGARTVLGEQEVVIWGAFYDPSWPSYLATPGQVVGRLPGQGVMVKTGDSTLLVKEAEVQGVVATPTWPIGTRLGVNLVTHLRRLEAKVKCLEQQALMRRDG